MTPNMTAERKTVIAAYDATPRPMSEAIVSDEKSSLSRMSAPERMKMSVFTRWPTIPQNSCKKCSTLASMRTLP